MCPKGTKTVHASSIRLDSTFGLTVAGILALLAVLAVPWFWEKWKWPRAGRSISTLTAVVLVLMVCGLALNMIGGFFPTLGSLIGTSDVAGEGTDGDAGANGVALDRLKDYHRDRGTRGNGSTVHLTVSGERSGVTRDVNIYLPSQYYDPVYEGFTFPVVEWIPNYPSGPEVAGSGYHLPEALDNAIRKKLLPPSVIVIPDPDGTPKVGHDSECVDQVDGTANDTFLSSDIRNWALRTLHVSGDRKSWTIAGWSSGGYCALNLATRHPQWYANAVSVSGYDRALVDSDTQDLFKGRQDIVDANNVSHNVGAHPSPIEILMIAGEKEGNELGSIERIRKALAPPGILSSWTIPDGGHNMNAFKAQLSDVLTWIGAKSASPRFTGGHQVAVSGEVKPWPLPDAGAKGGLVDTTQ
jgi:enterochelin esterase-like enzyme